MFARILTIISVVSSFLLLLLLVLTNPSDTGPVVILLVFVLIYLSLLGVVTFLLYFGARGVYFLMQLTMNRQVRSRLSLSRAYLYATIMAALPMIVMGLSSADGLKWYELLLVGIFGCIGVLYIARRTKN